MPSAPGNAGGAFVHGVAAEPVTRHQCLFSAGRRAGPLHLGKGLGERWYASLQLQVNMHSAIDQPERASCMYKTAMEADPPPTRYDDFLSICPVVLFFHVQVAVADNMKHSAPHESTEGRVRDKFGSSTGPTAIGSQLGVDFLRVLV